MDYIKLLVCGLVGGVVASAVFMVFNHTPKLVAGNAASSNSSTLTNQFVFTQGIQVGTTTNRTLFSQIQSGTCTGIAYAALSTSTQIDCAVTGAKPGDVVLMQLPLGATQVAATGIFSIADSGASSTIGYLTATLKHDGIINIASTSSYPQATTSIKYLLWR